MNAAVGEALTKDAIRAPSPLNGERAGVRGENATKPLVSPKIFLYISHR
jgi:hypothetical protein